MLAALQAAQEALARKEAALAAAQAQLAEVLAKVAARREKWVATDACSQA
jgi:hypothetical protein